MNKYHILISACLMGQKVRYDGLAKLILDPIVQYWQEQELLVAICPEVSGGLPTPRPAAEIQAPTYKGDKIAVINIAGVDVTSEFKLGAELALQKCHNYNIPMAILTDGSPSCGNQLINDGSFKSKKISGEGVTTALLRENNIKVFNQNQLKQADNYYQQIIRKMRSK